MSEADQGQMFDKPADATPTPTAMFEAGGRQYDVDAAKKKIENADQFIEQLKTERQQDLQKMQDLEAKIGDLNSKLDTATKLDEVLAAKGQASTPAQPQVEQTSPQVDESALIQKLKNQLEQESQIEKQASNMQTSIEKASSVFGTEWQSKLLEKGKSLNMDGAAIESMAKTNPTAFAQLFGLNSSKPSSEPAPSSSSAATGGFKTEEPKSVMFGGTTKDLVAQWRYSGTQVAGDEYTPELHTLQKRKARF